MIIFSVDESYESGKSTLKLEGKSGKTISIGCNVSHRNLPILGHWAEEV